MSNKTYDILKWVAQYLLPALATLYFAVAKIWGLPYGCLLYTSPSPRD